MDNGQWGSGTMMGDAKAESGAGEFGHDGNSVESGADPNYMYQPGHNGNAPEGY
jgi:hypothetical protein